MTVSVVICTNSEERWDLLLRATRSVLEQRRKAEQVILVVDHSERLLMRAREELTGFTVIPNTDHPGLAGARNTGLRAATTEVVAFLDDDAEADDRWLEELLRPYEYPDVVGVGGWTDPLWRSKPRWFPDEFNWVVGCSFPDMPVGAGVRNFFGVNMSFRRDMALQIGGFSTELSSQLAKQILDDTEFCIRIVERKPHSVLFLEPRARVAHHVSPGRATVSYFFRRCLSEGRAKAIMSSTTGTRTGLAAERTYLLKTLPKAIGRHFAESVRERDSGPILRGFMILFGTACVGGQFIRTRVGRPPAFRDASKAQ